MSVNHSENEYVSKVNNHRIHLTEGSFLYFSIKSPYLVELVVLGA